MTTFWCQFFNPDRPRQEQFKGVAIVELDESAGRVSVVDVARHCFHLGINPGGAMKMTEVRDPEALKALRPEHRNRLITDDALLVRLGSRGRSKVSMH